MSTGRHRSQGPSLETMDHKRSMRRQDSGKHPSHPRCLASWVLGAVGTDGCLYCRAQGRHGRGSCGSSSQQKQNRGGSPGDQIFTLSVSAPPPRPPCIINAPHHSYQSALSRAALGGGQSLRMERLHVLVRETQPTSQISSQQLLTTAAIATVSHGTCEKQCGWRDERFSRKRHSDLCLLRSLRAYL